LKICVHTTYRGDGMKMMTKMMAALGSMGFIGYMYFKKNPEALCKMREMGKDVSQKMYNMFDME